MKKTAAILFICAVVAACAPFQEKIKITSSGMPEGDFIKKNLDEVRNILIGGCISKGIPVLETNSNSIVCSKELEGGRAMIAQMAIGNSHSTTPRAKVRFMFYQMGADVRVTSTQWLETQMAFGQVNTMSMDGNNDFNSIQQFLYSLGAK